MPNISQMVMQILSGKSCTQAVSGLWKIMCQLWENGSLQEGMQEQEGPCSHDVEVEMVPEVQEEDVLPLVTYTSEYYQYVYPHVDPHLSPLIAQQWVSMCIRPICIHIDNLEVFSRDRTGIINAPEGFRWNFNEGLLQQCMAYSRLPLVVLIPKKS